MPFEHEHSCRLEDPNKFQDNSFRRMKRKHEGKEYSIIMGRLKGETTMTEQAYRYDKEVWSTSEARSHCKDHDGSFEAAQKESSMKLEHKAILIELRDKEMGAFIARIATLNVRDKDNDITLSGAFPEGKTVLVSAYMHGSWMGKLPVGKATIKESGDEVIAQGQFNLNTTEGKDTYEAIKFAPELQEWSYGFFPTEAEPGKDENEGARILKKVDVKEISPVLVGAGVNTGVIAIKSENQPYAEQAESVLAAVNDLVIRTESLADLRRKEGRGLSSANRERMKKLLDSLSEVATNLKGLLAATEPKDDKALLQAILLYTKIKNELSEVI